MIVLLVLRIYACLAKRNGIGRASLRLIGSTSEKGGLRLDLANPAVSAIRSGQYWRRLRPKTHQRQTQLLLHVTGFVGRNKKSSDLRVQGGLLSRIGTKRVARTYCKYLGELNKLINSFRRELD